MLKHVLAFGATYSKTISLHTWSFSCLKCNINIHEWSNRIYQLEGMTSPRSSSPRSPRGSSPGHSPRDSPRGDSPRGASPRGAHKTSCAEVSCITRWWFQIFSPLFGEASHLDLIFVWIGLKPPPRSTFPNWNGMKDILGLGRRNSARQRRNSTHEVWIKLVGSTWWWMCRHQCHPKLGGGFK